jgi:hypothetical protein
MVDYHQRPLDFVRSEAGQTFPLADNPVNQIVAPFWFNSSDRSLSATAPSWKVMLVDMLVLLNINLVESDELVDA